MDRFDASIAALIAFRMSLATYRSHMADALDSADGEVRRVQSALDQAEQHWRRELGRRNAALQDCYRAQIAAAQQGGHVDCSGYVRALEDAEETLARVLRAASSVQQAAERYRSARIRYADVLENGLSRARAYVDACVWGFTSYRAEGFSHPALQSTLVADSGPKSAGGPACDGPAPDAERPVDAKLPEGKEGGEYGEREPKSRN